MKIWKRIAALVLMTCLLTSAGIPAEAEGPFDFQITASSESVQAGDWVDVLVSLQGYTQGAVGIRGIQVDIENVNPQVLSVTEMTTLITDSGAISNTPSFHAEKNRVRLLYARMGGTLPAPVTDIFKVRFTVNSDLKGAGSITMPATVKIVTEQDDRITLKSQLVIHYKPKPVVKVDIVWGSLEYQYEDPVWNPRTHIYEGGGWKAQGSGDITVRNSGDTAANADFHYDPRRREIAGKFTENGIPLEGPITLNPGDRKIVHLSLSGKPETALEKRLLGIITIQIGGE